MPASGKDFENVVIIPGLITLDFSVPTFELAYELDVLRNNMNDKKTTINEVNKISKIKV